MEKRRDDNGRKPRITRIEHFMRPIQFEDQDLQRPNPSSLLNT
jgi:hypothetical protein